MNRHAMPTDDIEKNVEKFVSINVGRIGISLLFVALIFCNDIEYPIFIYGSILHLTFSIIWFIVIQYDIFIEENHIYSGYIPCTLDVVTCTAFIIVTGNVFSPLLITYVIIIALTAVVVYKYISLYSAFLIALAYISMGISTITGYLPNINLFSKTLHIPNYSLLFISSAILCLGLFVVRNIVRRFVKTNADLYQVAEHEKKITERLLDVLQDNYKIIEERNDTMNRDLQLARSIQLSLIPQPPKDIDGIIIAAIYHPMHQVGGDFYDFIYFKETKDIGIFISDVSGHGVPAALITSMLKTLINTAGKERTSPDNLLAYINKNLYDQTNQNFITAIYAIYDTASRMLTFSRAGHPPLILIREDRIEYISAKGGLLAINKIVEFEIKTIQLNIGDKVLLVTDGLLEALGKNGVDFEEFALSESIFAHRYLPINRLINMLFGDLVEYCGSRHFEDDICIVGFEVN